MDYGRVLSHHNEGSDRQANGPSCDSAIRQAPLICAGLGFITGQPAIELSYARPLIEKSKPVFRGPAIRAGFKERDDL